MRRLRTLSSRRLIAIVAAVAVLATTAAIAQAGLIGGEPKPEPKALDRAILDAANAPTVDGISARIEFTNGLIPSGSLPNGGASPLAAGADGRLWMARRRALPARAPVRVRRRPDRLRRPHVERLRRGGEDRLPPRAARRAARRGRPRARHAGAGPARARPARPRVDAVRRRADLDRAAGRPTPCGSRRRTTAACSAPASSPGTPSRACRCAPPSTPRTRPSRCSSSRPPTSPSGAWRTMTCGSRVPAGTKTVDVDPPAGRHGGTKGEAGVEGVEAVQDELDFQLSAPDELAGLPAPAGPARAPRRRQRRAERVRRGPRRHRRAPARGVRRASRTRRVAPGSRRSTSTARPAPSSRPPSARWSRSSAAA